MAFLGQSLRIHIHSVLHSQRMYSHADDMLIKRCERFKSNKKKKNPANIVRAHRDTRYLALFLQN